MEFAKRFTRTDAERDWAEFIRWIGYADLTKAVDRKRASLTDAMLFKDIVPKLFAIELGISQILQRWKTTRALPFPRNKPIYDAYSFIGSAIAIRSYLTREQAAVFRSRIVADILPTGRLSNLEHEFRIAQNLRQFGWEIVRSGFCGDAGPDFIARRASSEIEVEGKCISPEVGLPVTFGFVGRLLSQIGKNLKNKHPNQFVKLRIELLRDDRNFDSDAIKRRAIQSYERTENLDSGDFRITIEVEQLDSFGKTFEAELKREDVIPSLFESVRSRRGDYGYFARFEDELVFLNLVPIRESRQAKNMFKLISDTCDRQFTKGRPAFLWLHLQALDAAELKPPFEPLPFVERLARHAFKSEQRTHVASLIVSGDTNVEGKSYPLRGRNVRGMESIGYVKGFDNPRCHFDPGPVFAPLFEQ